MLRIFAPRLLLTLALLVAQIGAEVHAYSHLSGDLRGLNNSSGQACGECLSSAPLLAAAGIPACALALECAATHEIPLARVSQLIERTSTYAFQSRAPPFLV